MIGYIYKYKENKETLGGIRGLTKFTRVGNTWDIWRLNGHVLFLSIVIFYIVQFIQQNIISYMIGQIT